MARQNKIFLSGKVANLIFYERNGKSYARSMPSKVRLSTATKANNKQFGKANRLSKNLRAGLHPVLPDPKDRRMMYDLTNAVKDWLTDENPGKTTVATDLPYITGFEFNRESELHGRVRKKIKADYSVRGKIIVTIPSLDPAKDIAAPAYTHSIDWKIMVATAAIDKDMMGNSYTTEINMPYSNGVQAASQLELPVTSKAGEIAIVIIALRYHAKKKGTLKIIEEKRWLPAGVVGSCCGQHY